MRMSQSQIKMIVESVSDASRLLANVHFAESITRRRLISSILIPQSRDVMAKTTVGPLLFGNILTETLKNAKILKNRRLI